MKIDGFDPIADFGAKVLILGTIPGECSLAKRRYYADPGNAFWFVMGRLFLFEARPELDYQAYLSELVRSKVALWDVLQSDERDGSADANIVPGSEVPNDFDRFFECHPSVRTVFFNGIKAKKLYRKYVNETPSNPAGHLVFRCLPSTSSNNTHLTKEGKPEACRAVKHGLALTHVLSFTEILKCWSVKCVS